MNLEEHLAKDLSSQVTQAIDFEILARALIECGWYLVKLPRLLNRKHSIDIIEWCEENTCKKYKNMGSTFVFEDQGDAVNFALRWT